MSTLIVGLVSAFAAALVVYLLTQKKVEPTKEVPASQPVVIKPKINESDPLVFDASAKAREIILEARDEALKLKREAEEESRRTRGEALKLEKRIEERQTVLDVKSANLIKHEEDLAKAEVDFKEKVSGLTSQIEKIALLTKDEARQILLTRLDQELTEEVAKKIKVSEEKIKTEADRRAKELIIEAMQHASTDYVPEYTVSTIKLSDEDVKGRIIGKEGRNIRSFEMSTGVDVDLDEAGEIRLSSFDSVRREIARVSMERLISDGRIQPARIEEIVEKTKKDIEKIMHEEGEKLAHNVGVYSLPLDIINLLGRFKYRFSYGQNMIAHTLEETKIGVYLAGELGADVDVARLGCLLHDIGKVVMDDEGTHVELGVSLLRRYNFPEKIINCVAEHHEDKPFSSIESIIVNIADSVSGSRPGARVEDYGEYIKRMTNLEKAAQSFKGVRGAFAISAGREVRVIVDPGAVTDAESINLAHDIALKIEKEQTYAGQVKVTVIREIRASGIAK